jgi:hypothetical protein
MICGIEKKQVKDMRSFLHLQARAITIVLTLSSASAGAESRPELRSLPTEPSSAVFIGNSFFYYNNGITSLVRGLLRGLPQAPAWALPSCCLWLSRRQRVQFQAAISRQ